ncbi:hypothetical protein QBC45DRAFT_17643 [Copromyces sp. CBS 386.78]|nr:hypothetical protein QBC45DRAFT_17643 [Copromyces sp. CBS 386.78]
MNGEAAAKGSQGYLVSQIALPLIVRFRFLRSLVLLCLVSRSRILLLLFLVFRRLPGRLPSSVRLPRDRWMGKHMPFAICQAVKRNVISTHAREPKQAHPKKPRRFPFLPSIPRGIPSLLANVCRIRWAMPTSIFCVCVMLDDIPFLPAPSLLEKEILCRVLGWAQNGTVAVGPRTRKPSRWARVPCRVICKTRLTFQSFSTGRFVLIFVSGVWVGGLLPFLLFDIFPGTDKPYSFGLFADRFLITGRRVPVKLGVLMPIKIHFAVRH